MAANDNALLERLLQRAAELHAIAAPAVRLEMGSSARARHSCRATRSEDEGKLGSLSSFRDAVAQAKGPPVAIAAF